MSVVHLIDTLAEWAKENVCAHIQLKQAPAPDAPEDGGYDYNLVRPAVFPMYVPTSEKLPPNIHAPFPSLCVRFVKGSDSVINRTGSVDVQLCFSAWNPGTHGRDILHPVDGTTFKPWSEWEAQSFFQRTSDGWRDVYNFVDIALRAIESVSCIGQYTIDKSIPIEFGPLTEQESIPDFYPMWFAWISFRVTYPLQRNNPDIENLL